MEINGLNLNVLKGDLTQMFYMFDKFNPTKTKWFHLYRIDLFLNQPFT